MRFPPKTASGAFDDAASLRSTFYRLLLGMSVRTVDGSDYLYYLRAIYPLIPALRCTYIAENRDYYGRKPMRLSEAILLGSTLGPQVFGSLFDPSEPGSSCALGAAFEAIGHDTKQFAAWKNWLAEPYQECPAGCVAVPARPGNDSYTNVGQVIAHLNDYHHWTRARIAKWVATVEPQEPSEPETVEPREPSEPEPTRKGKVLQWPSLPKKPCRGDKDVA
jgi:hypothetical protein